MFRKPAVWLLVAGLVLTRLLGLHVHACGGLDGTLHPHESPHYADSGLLFGESHDAHHPDDREIDLALATLSSKLHLDDQLPALLPSTELKLAGAIGWLTVRVPRGPPLARAPFPDFFSPPLRGPPAVSLT